MSSGEGAGYIYFMGHTGLTKIGYSCYPYGRLLTFKPLYPGIVLAHEIETNAMRHLERFLHWQLRDYHAQDIDHEGEEWFRLPASEMARLRGIKRYDLKPEMIAWLASEHTRPVLPWRQERTRRASSCSWGRGPNTVLVRQGKNRS